MPTLLYPGLALQREQEYLNNRRAHIDQVIASQLQRNG
jgi:hypothetical protein